MGPLTPKGRPLPASNGIPGDASVNGLYFTEDPVAITQGRMADPHKADEFVIDAATAKAFGYHVGEEIPVGWLTNAQANSGNLAPNSTIPADQRARVKLVGIAGGQATNLFEDQDEAQGQSIMLFTPALTNKLLACCSNDHADRADAAGRQPVPLRGGNEIKGVLPKGLPFVYVQVEDRVAIANDTLRPEAIALAVFGGIAGFAALLIAGQVVSRRIRLRAAGPRRHPGPRGEPGHDLLRRPDRHARRRGWSAPSWPGWWPSASRRWRRWGRCGRSSASRCTRTGR